MANGGQHVVQRLTIGVVIVHVVRRNQWHAGIRRGPADFDEIRCVVAEVAFYELITAVTEHITISTEPSFELTTGIQRVMATPWRQHAGDEPVGMRLHVAPAQVTFALLGTTTTVRNEFREIRIAAAIHRQHHGRRSVRGRDFRTNNQTDSRFFRSHVGTYNAAQAVAISDGERSVTKL